MTDLHSELTQSDLATTSVQSMWDRFATKLEQGIDKFIPTRKSGTRDGFLWINQEIRRLMRKRDKLYKRWSRSGRPYDQSKLLNSKHLVRRASEKAHEKYLGDIFGINNEIPDQDVGKPPEVKTKKLYILLKHSKQDSNVIAPLKKDGQTLLTEVGKANALNDQFQSVLSPKTPISLKSLAQKSLQDLNDSGANLPFQPSHHPKMPDISIAAEVIDKLLKGLSIHKAAGPDKFKPIALQTLHKELAPIMQLIFQRSIDAEKILDIWK